LEFFLPFSMLERQTPEQGLGVLADFITGSDYHGKDVL